MSDEWISHADLVEAVGEPAALVLCACRGGQSLYIPHAPEGCALSAMLGQDAAERLCAVWGGLNVIVPNLRRGGPLKPEILARLERGERPGPIAEDLRVTIRYVRHLARQMRTAVPAGTGPDRCSR